MFTHVFVTHANLQLHLTAAIVRDLGLDPDRVLLIQVRGSYGRGERLPFETLNGDRYQRSTGVNPVKHRRRNAAILARFQDEVMSRLAEGYTVLAPMYTYWYLRALAAGAGKYYFLEDGFGSFRTLAELDATLPVERQPALKEGLRNGLRELGLVAAQRIPVTPRQELFRGSAGGFITSPLSFPWLPPGKRHLVSSVFSPGHIGEFDGAVMLCLSCHVEVGNFSLPDYLALQQYVLGRLADRGVQKVYLKYHPLQLNKPNNLRAYRTFFQSPDWGVMVEELSSDHSMERIAASNRITLVTGFSTLTLSVSQTGNQVWTFLPEILRRSEKVRTALPESVVRVVGELAEEL